MFERAREQTQKFRNLPSTLAREDKQEQSLDCRNPMARCHDPMQRRCGGCGAQPSPGTGPRARYALGSAQSTPTRGSASAKKPVPGTGGQRLPQRQHRKAPAGKDQLARRFASLTSTLSALGRSVSNLASAPAAASASAAAAAPAASFKPGVAEPQPPEFVSGSTQFSGKFVRDPEGTSYSGTGKITWTNGDVYDGTLVKGQRQGKGLFIWANGQRFEGDWVQDTPSGKGKMQFANGNRYDGDVVAGIPQGMGRMQYASGDDYSGRFNAGVPDGRGTYTWKNGQTFDGEWKSERPNGQGILKFANGNVFEGTVVNGVPNGQGKLAFVTGELYTGARGAG